MANSKTATTGRTVLTLLSIITLSACLGTKLNAQSNFWDSPDAYLGQPRPSDSPKIFAPGLLADSGTIVMDRIAFSPDGREIYYCQNDQWLNLEHAKIKCFKYADHKWNGPTVLNQNFYAPAFSMDGNTLFMSDKFTNRVWQSKRTADGWSAPAIYLQEPYALYEFMPTNSGACYVGSNPDPIDAKNGGTYVIQFSVLTLSNGGATVKSLGIPLNEPGFNGDFFIARDESFMVVSTKETKDYESELYISYRKADKSWTKPKSLGPAINDGLAHRWGQFVTPDNKYLFYTRGTSPKACAIFWVRFDKLLEDLKHTNFDPYVKTPIADQTAIAGTRFSFKVDDATFFDDDGNDTLSFTASLADGGPLPSWMHFDPATKIISGTPLASGTYKITVTATDTAKASALSSFSVIVK
jgi:hypothetical protein